MRENCMSRTYGVCHMRRSECSVSAPTCTLSVGRGKARSGLVWHNHGVSDAALVAHLGEALTAYNGQDWERFRVCFTDDLVVADHRPPPAVYDGIIGADNFVATVQALFDLASDVSVAVVGTHVVNRRSAVF